MLKVEKAKTIVQALLLMDNLPKENHPCVVNMVKCHTTSHLSEMLILAEKILKEKGLK